MIDEYVLQYITEYLKLCLHRGSNSGPFAYKANALPLSYKGVMNIISLLY